jgi:hypothetical protein
LISASSSPPRCSLCRLRQECMCRLWRRQEIHFLFCFQSHDHLFSQPRAHITMGCFHAARGQSTVQTSELSFHCGSSLPLPKALKRAVKEGRCMWSHSDASADLLHPRLPNFVDPPSTTIVRSRSWYISGFCWLRWRFATIHHGNLAD